MVHLRQFYADLGRLTEKPTAVPSLRAMDQSMSIAMGRQVPNRTAIGGLHAWKNGTVIRRCGALLEHLAQLVAPLLDVGNPVVHRGHVLGDLVDIVEPVRNRL